MKPTNSTKPPNPIDAMPETHPLKRYYRLAEACGTYHEITPATAQWSAWARYFDEVWGARPLAMGQRAKNFTKAFTVAAEWPEHFDTSFSMDGAALTQGAMWSEDAAVRFVAMKRVSEDAVEGGWISQLIDHVREHHRLPTLDEADAMLAAAGRFDERHGQIEAGVHAAGFRNPLMRLADALAARRRRLASAVEAERIVIRSRPREQQAA